MSAITSSLAGAVVLLDTGRSSGLPEPTDIWVGRRVVEFQFDAVDNLTAWASHVGGSVGEFQAENGVLYRAQAELLDQPLRLSCFVRAEVAAG